MKKSVRNAIALIVIAVLSLAAAVAGGLGYLSFGGVAAWRLILGGLCLAWLVFALCRLEFENIFLPIAFLFLLFEKWIALWIGAPSETILPTWLLIVCAVMLTIGFGILRRRILPGKKKRISFEIGGEETDRKEKEADDKCGKIGGNTTKYIDCSCFENESVENDMGACAVHFTNTEAYRGGGVLAVDNNLGSMVIHVPARWRLVTDVDNTLGSVAEAKSEGVAPDAPLLTIHGENNLGSLQIKRV